MTENTNKTECIIIELKQRENGLYGTDMISFLKPLKPILDKKLNSVDQIMFQLFSMQIKEGFAKDEVKTMNDWFKEKLGVEVRTV